MIQKEQGARAAHLSIAYMCIEMHFLFLMWVGGCYISNALIEMPKDHKIQ